MRIISALGRIRSDVQWGEWHLLVDSNGTAVGHLEAHSEGLHA